MASLSSEKTCGGIFKYLDLKDLLNCRLVCRQWNQDILTHRLNKQKDLICFVDLASVRVKPFEAENDITRLNVSEESLDNFDETMREFVKFLTKSSIKRAGVKRWVMHPINSHELASIKSIEERRVMAINLIREYLTEWQPVMAKLCDVMRKITYFHLLDSHLYLEVWRWLTHHCGLESLHCEQCTIIESIRKAQIEGVVDIDWPHTVSADPLFSLTKFRIRHCKMRKYDLCSLALPLHNLRHLDLSYTSFIANNSDHLQIATSDDYDHSTQEQNLLDKLLDPLLNIYIKRCFERMLNYSLPLLRKFTIGPYLEFKHDLRVFSAQKLQKLTFIKDSPESLKQLTQILERSLPKNIVMHTVGENHVTYQHANTEIHCKFVPNKYKKTWDDDIDAKYTYDWRSRKRR